MINKPFAELVMVNTVILRKVPKTLGVKEYFCLMLRKQHKKQYVWLHKSHVVKQEDSASFCEYQQ